MNQIITILILSLLFLSCSDDEQCPVADNLDLFEEFWLTFSHEYAAFEILNKDWDKIKEEHRSLVNSNSTEAELFEVFKSMLFELEDAHSDLHTNSSLGSIQYYNEVTDKSLRNYIGWQDLKEIYLDDVVETSDELAYAKVQNSNIGYLRIRGFSGALSQYNIADRLLSTYENLDGIIIDVRNNGGGNEANAAEIASNFADVQTIYRYARLKEGCVRNELSDFHDLEIEPKENQGFEGQLVLLTNKKTFSAGEDFTLMMKALPNVVHIGDNTWGGFATGPTNKTLSNGWKYRVSRKVSYDLDKNPIVGGIQPDEKVFISEVDNKNNVDLILERAIEILN